MSIRIPVNPDYDFDVAPSDQAEYANPVVLNNKLIQNANVYIAVSHTLYTLMQKVVVAKQEHREAEASKRDFDKAAIITGQPNSNDRKTTLLLEAFIMAQIQERDLGEVYQALQNNERNTRSAMELLQSKIQANQQILASVEASTVNIQTHLSYVKTEMRNAGNY